MNGKANNTNIECLQETCVILRDTAVPAVPLRMNSKNVTDLKVILKVDAV